MIWIYLDKDWEIYIHLFFLNSTAFYWEKILQNFVMT